MKELKITEKTENPLLSRTNIKFEIAQGGEPVPSRLKVRDLLASNLKKDKELIIIRHITSDFGTSNIKGDAVVYASKKVLERIEPKYTVQRIESKEEAAAKAKEEPKAEAAPAEQPAEEAPKEEEKPAEEAKEEPKEEKSE